MEREVKKCVNCRKEFAIEPEPRTKARLSAGLRSIFSEIYE